MVLTAVELKTIKTDISKLDIPEHIQILFDKIQLEHYEELYEEDSDGTVSLEDTLQEILQSLSDSNKTLTHLRYLWMTLILTLVVEPTLKYYQPQNLLYQNIINSLADTIVNIITNNLQNHKNNVPDLNIEELQEIIFENNFYTEKNIVNSQILDEALDVFYNAIRVIDYNQSVEAILEILEDCLEGYAIFPGSYGRRELFDWWLLDVVPASYNLFPPKRFYVVEGIKNQEEIKLRQTFLLKRVSRKIRTVIKRVELNQRNNHIFPTTDKINHLPITNNGKMYQSKIPQLANL